MTARVALALLVVALVAALAWGFHLRTVAREHADARAALCRALGSHLVGVASGSTRASTHLDLVTTMSDVLTFCGVDTPALSLSLEGPTLAEDAARTAALLRAAGESLQRRRAP